MQKLVIATSNPHKVEEIEAVLGQLGIVCVALRRSDIPEPIEDGATFEENARIKAIAYAQALGVTVLADDSGLEVDALDGRPGVHSARFVCTLCVARPDGTIEAQTRGTFEGRIGHAPRGSNGFGYDPLLVLEDGRTSAELSAQEKNARSHRGDALRKLVACWSGASSPR